MVVGIGELLISSTTKKSKRRVWGQQVGQKAGLVYFSFSAQENQCQNNYFTKYQEKKKAERKV